MVLSRLDLRRVAGLAGASLMVVMLTCGYSFAHAASPPAEQAVEIVHQPLRCWPAEEHVVLSIDVEPAGDVQKNLVYFRWDRNAVWYFVPMFLNAQGAWVAVLPRTAPDTTGVVYFFESMSSSYMATRSDEVRAPVSSRCNNAAAVIYTGTNPNITLGATGGPPLAPGFQASGITSFISPTGMTTGATGAGGGISGRTMALIGGAGGAGAVFALAGGGGDGGATTTMDAIGGITSTVGTTTTVTGGGGPTTTTTGGGGPTTTIGGGGGTTTIIGGGSTSTVIGGSTTTVFGSTTTLPGSTTTVFGSTTTLPGSTTTLPGSTTTLPGSTTTLPGSTTTTPPSTTTTSTASTTSSSGSTSTIALGPEMRVTKNDSQDPVAPNDIFDYIIVVRNDGDTAASGVRLEDNLPSQVSFRAVTGSPSCSPFTASLIICLFGNFAPGRVETIRIQVQVNSGAGSGSMTNSATVFSSEPTISANESTTISSTLKTAASTVQTLTLRSFLDFEPYDGTLTGSVVANGTSHFQVVNTGFLEHPIDVRAGLNRIEATVADAGSKREGYWRFDLGASSRVVSGSLRVESGQVVAVEGRSIVFAVRRGSTPLRFTFEVEN